MFDLDALAAVEDGLRRLAGPAPDDVRGRRAMPGGTADRGSGPVAAPSSGGGCPHLRRLAMAEDRT